MNDVSGFLHDPPMADLVAQAGCAVCVMHSKGSPVDMQNDPRYGDVVAEVYGHLAERIETAVAAGIRRDRIIADPGIGFGKTRAHNLALVRDIGLLHGLGCAILLGASRKRFIGTIGHAEAPPARAPGSIAVALAAVARGVHLLRVHDVVETVQALRLWMALAGEREGHEYGTEGA